MGNRFHHFSNFVSSKMEAPAPGGDSGNMLEFLRLLDTLKFKKRRGWTFFPEITEVETIACHMHRMA
jgi:hypothetical protein